MKKLVLLVFLVGITAVTHAGSWGSTVRVFKNLTRSVGLRGVQLVIVKGNHINAYATCSRVTVTTAAVYSLTEDEMAVMIGHELGHILYGHGCRTPEKPFYSERDADLLAVKIVKKYGKYNVCRGGVGLFKKFLRTYGDQSDKYHPKTSYRIKLMYKYACGR